MRPSTYPRRSDYDTIEEYHEAVDAWYEAADQYAEEYYERTRDFQHGTEDISFCSLEQNQLQRAYREEEWLDLSLMGMGLA